MCMEFAWLYELSDINKGYIFGTKIKNICKYWISCQLGDSIEGAWPESI